MPASIVEVVPSPTRPRPVTDVDTAFMAGFSALGTTSEAIEINSPADIEAKLGERDSTYPWLYDALDVFFAEGGGRAYVARRTGPNPVKASKTLQDSESADTVKVEALNVGAYGNDIDVEVTASDTERTLTVYYDDALVETHSGLASRADFADITSDYVAVSLTGTSTSIPAALEKTALTGGDDDAADSTETELGTALDLFDKDLGPGQVLAPGVTDGDSHGVLAEHAAENNRLAFLDAPNTSTVATVTSSAETVTTGEYSRYAAMFAPWPVIAGPLQGQTREVSPAAMAAALAARSDRAGNPPDEPAANTNGDSAIASALAVTSWTDTNRETLNDAGVNAFKQRNGGGVTLFGYRTLVDPDVDNKWVPLGAARVLMQIVAELGAVADRFVLRRIDGKRQVLVELDAALAQPLEAHVAAGSLEFEFEADGVTPIPGTAYQIDTSWDPDTRELAIDVPLRLTDMAETVRVRIIRRASGEAL